MLNQDFVIAAINMVSKFTPRNLDYLVSLEWRDNEHLYDELITHIPENNWEDFDDSWNDCTRSYYST